ncbi:zinc-binding alcohol dehydrogenase family protein [Marilutibacter chinensis]|uniref:Zinc-type alcohol dehydrogenase-like protein n=1 Tax=Marilutibacter chinensis TaxID=2912247 RepID=A0ABS9HSA5_9GAMM|nr:zinc-binding alcohol dehydrogenase family protein [Lysobacter chinensis]MCF7221806.1 zinc-binding alcohol dehydrogenase family protein [Lysobacter chinensis]MCF7222975.1 zinc-binding alcohol dehydrogenase family protein [Lysobacter chinensis]
MKAVALTRYLPIDDPASLQDFDLPEPPAPAGHDILVRVSAVSVNPVDTKVRSPKDKVEETPRILGYDACGIVEAVGDAVSRFKPGDRVYYAGDFSRPGSNAELQLVDSRVTGHAPRTLDDGQAAALPLVAITAWELLFQRMPYDSGNGGAGKSLLVIAGAGGVGSIAIQLARRAGFTVIATASREDSAQWCRAMGAHHVVNHREPLAPQLKTLGFDTVDAAINLADTVAYWDVLGGLLAPQGHVGLIVEPSAPLHIGDPYKMKCIGIHWEMMFARPVLKTPDIDEQGRILDRIAALVDAGELKSIQRDALKPIDAANLREAHRRLESGATTGKLVLSGW